MAPRFPASKALPAEKKGDLASSWPLPSLVWLALVWRQCPLHLKTSLHTHSLTGWGRQARAAAELSPKLAPVYRHFIRLHVDPLVSGQVRAGRPTALFPARSHHTSSFAALPREAASSGGLTGPWGAWLLYVFLLDGASAQAPPTPTASLMTKPRGPAPQPAAAACLRVCRGPLAESPGSGGFSVWPLRDP